MARLAPTRLSATLAVLRVVNLRVVRRHTIRALLAALSLGGGVAVVVAVMIETTSVSTAIDDVGYRIAGPAPLRFVGAATRGGVDPTAIADVRALPGVAAAVPIVRAVTMVRDNGRETFVLAVGADCSAQWIVDPVVCAPGTPEPQVMATSEGFGRSLGPAATLATDLGELPLRAVAHATELDAINNGYVVVVPLREAKRQFARGDRVDMVYVTVGDGVDVTEVRSRMSDVLGPGYRVMTSDEPARAFNVNTVLFPLLAVFALVAGGVGVILIAQITRLSVEERRRDIAVAAALGASPQATMTGFLAEAALLGVAGAGVGILMGLAISRPVVASASELTELYVGVNVPVVVTPGIVVAGVAIGVLLAVAAAVIPSVSAARTPVATELCGRAAHDSTKSRALWPKAVGMLAVGAAGALAAKLAGAAGGLEPWQAVVADVAVVAAIVGLLSAAAFLSAQIIAAVRIRPYWPHCATVAVAATSLRADGSRTTAIAGAVAVPVAIATLLSGFLVAINRGASDVARAQADGQLVATTTRFTDWGTVDAKFAPRTIADIAVLPGVDAVDRMAEIEINLADGSLAYVRAEDRPAFPFAVLAGQAPQDSIETGQLVVGAVLAREQRLRIGDRLRLGSGSRARDMVVSTVVATPELGGRRIYLPYPTADEIFGAEPAGLLLITPAPGFTAGQVEAAVTSLRMPQPVTVIDAEQYRTATADGVARFLTPLNALKYGLLGIAFISVASTLLLVGMRRRREVALVQALGATRWKVFAITTLEALLAGVTGATVGALLSVLIMATVGWAAVVLIGSVTPLTFPWSEAAKYAGLAAVAAVLAAVIPAWRNTQTAPATELREE